MSPIICATAYGVSCAAVYDVPPTVQPSRFSKIISCNVVCPLLMQPMNAPLSIFFTFAPIVTLRSMVQFLNAYILIAPLPVIATSVSPLGILDAPPNSRLNAPSA